MRNIEIYLAYVEVAILPQSDLYDPKYNFAFVYGFVPATDVDNCLTKLRQEFFRIGCNIISVESVYPYAGTEWEKKKQQKEFDGYAKESKKSGQIIFGPFCTYPKEVAD